MDETITLIWTLTSVINLVLILPFIGEMDLKLWTDCKNVSGSCYCSVLGLIGMPGRLVCQLTCWVSSPVDVYNFCLPCGLFTKRSFLFWFSGELNLVTSMGYRTKF